MKTIQFKDAKAKLSAVVDDAVAGEPTVITRHGKEEAVVLSANEYRQLANARRFGELLMQFPGTENDIPARNRKPARSYQWDL
ncbi:MAG: type II toxin-antitoxin system Phd/YefM family antitoxin [Parvibaculaceae bacterium]